MIKKKILIALLGTNLFATNSLGMKREEATEEEIREESCVAQKKSEQSKKRVAARQRTHPYRRPTQPRELKIIQYVPPPQPPRSLEDQLAQAIRLKNIGEVQRLLTAGANPNAVKNNQTALMRAAAAGSPEIVRLILESPQTDFNSVYNQSALVKAVLAGSSETVRVLLRDARINPNARDVEDQITALHLASNIGNYELALEMLEDPRIQINVQTNFGFTALDYAQLRKFVTHPLKQTLINRLRSKGAKTGIELGMPQ